MKNTCKTPMTNDVKLGKTKECGNPISFHCELCSGSFCKDCMFSICQKCRKCFACIQCGYPQRYLSHCTNCWNCTDSVRY